MTTVFWISALLLLHTYFGYGFSAWLILRLRRTPATPSDKSGHLPRISFIIPACDEADIILEKCRNTLALDYPSELLDIIVVTDGSTDGTPDIAAGCPGIKVLHAPHRAGKAAAMNRAVHEVANAEVLVFSDANTFLSRDALLLMMRHYADPAMGGVSGEKRVTSHPGHPVHGEGIYWRYESFMKQLDASFYTLIAAAGELFSIRRELWQPIPEDTILDDLHISLSVCLRGWRFGYEPLAVATEPPSPSLADEIERKIRIAAGAFQILFRFSSLCWPFGHVRVWYVYLSRRVFRWTVAPLCLLLLLISNLGIVSAPGPQHPVYQITFYVQLLGYACALIGWGLIRAGRRAPWLLQVSFYFLFMHLSMYLGCLRFIFRKQTAVWRKSPRR